MFMKVYLAVAFFLVAFAAYAALQGLFQLNVTPMLPAAVLGFIGMGLLAFDYDYLNPDGSMDCLKDATS